MTLDNLNLRGIKSLMFKKGPYRSRIVIIGAIFVSLVL
jgi:hypothetical protein